MSPMEAVQRPSCCATGLPVSALTGHSHPIDHPINHPLYPRAAARVHSKTIMKKNTAPEKHVKTP